MKGNFKLLTLLIFASLSGVYFSSVSGLSDNIILQDIIMVVPLQILAFAYVGYYYRQKSLSKRS